MVSGSFSPRVSGKKTAKPPAVVATTPIIKTGASNQYTLNRSRSREVMPPILATKEQMNHSANLRKRGLKMEDYEDHVIVYR